MGKRKFDEIDSSNDFECSTDTETTIYTDNIDTSTDFSETDTEISTDFSETDAEITTDSSESDTEISTNYSEIDTSSIEIKGDGSEKDQIDNYVKISKNNEEIKINKDLYNELKKIDNANLNINSNTNLDSQNDLDKLKSIDDLINFNFNFYNNVKIIGKVNSINRLRITKNNNIYIQIMLKSLKTNQTLKITAWNQTVKPLIKSNLKYLDILIISGLSLKRDTSTYNYGSVNYVGNINLDNNNESWLDNLYKKEEMTYLKKITDLSIMPIKNQMISLLGRIVEIKRKENFIDFKMKDSKSSPSIDIRFWFMNDDENNERWKKEVKKSQKQKELQLKKLMTKKSIFIHGIYWNNETKVATIMPSSKIIKVTKK